jgi:hypothetical protein
MSERVAPQFNAIPITELTPMDPSMRAPVEALTRSFIRHWNYDTFSYIFELLETAEMEGRSLPQALGSFALDSLRLFGKFKGANCSGLSLGLAQALRDELSVDTALIPCFGNNMLTEAASEYIGLRTVGLLVKDTAGQAYTLQPGLTIDRLIEVSEGNTVNTFGESHRIEKASEEEFTLTSSHLNGAEITRPFILKALLNPDESSQRNLLRARHRYQLWRQHDTHRDYLGYSFVTGQYKLSLPTTGVHKELTPDALDTLISDQPGRLNETFSNPHLEGGLRSFSAASIAIKETLLLPTVQEALRS